MSDRWVLKLVGGLQKTDMMLKWPGNLNGATYDYSALRQAIKKAVTDAMYVCG